MYDTIIRGGKIVDGTGGSARNGDIAIKDGLIVDIGKLSGTAREEIDADGAIVTPGFVDVHTHYDGQVIWDDALEPSFSHGVTTAILGNCGVGFAPAEEPFRKPLVEMMEGVEEIPGIVLDEGLDWQWTSFPDYMERLAGRAYSMDVATHLTQAPLRVFVMGERALRHEAPTAQDIAEMARLVREAMDAGAVGFSVGRFPEHRSSRGEHVPGTFADDDELFSLAQAMGSSGHGVFQLIPKGAVGRTGDCDLSREDRIAEHERLVELARVSNRPLTYSVIEFASDQDDRQAMVAASQAARAMGVELRPQVSARGTGALMTLDGHHPFYLKPAYREIMHLPRAARAAAMREPERRAAILTQADDPAAVAIDPVVAAMIGRIASDATNHYVFTETFDYEPGPEDKVGVHAARAGKQPIEFLYDHITAGDGSGLLISFVLNYTRGDLDETREMLANPVTISGLGDGGAHMKLICDASMTTYQLSFWARDRKRGPTLPLEHMVHKLTKDGADLYGMHDRGEIAVGKRADINVIDFDRLSIGMPRMVFDLPQGGGRMLQSSTGYLATLVNGVATRRHDADTGARPGRLWRSGPAGVSATGKKALSSA